MKQIYFDNAATTKVDEVVVKEMLPYFTDNFGNASSQHDVGIKAKEVLEKSRKIIAKSIKANSSEIIFTSGGTEGNNFAGKWKFKDSEELHKYMEPLLNKIINELKLNMKEELKIFNKKTMILARRNSK